MKLTIYVSDALMSEVREKMPDANLSGIFQAALREQIAAPAVERIVKHPPLEARVARLEAIVARRLEA